MPILIRMSTDSLRNIFYLSLDCSRSLSLTTEVNFTKFYFRAWTVPGLLHFLRLNCFGSLRLNTFSTLFLLNLKVLKVELISTPLTGLLTNSDTRLGAWTFPGLLSNGLFTISLTTEVNFTKFTLRLNSFPLYFNSS